MSEKRIYVFIFIFCIFCLILSHVFFQNYLFMKPCEQCVYVRFAFCIVAFSFVFFFLKLEFIGFSLVFFGLFCGLKASLKLMQIHTALSSANPFLAPCSSTPHFAFNLPLDRLFPSFFKPTGICALDAPTPPSDVDLSTLQSFFVELYAQGWYLVPGFEFVTMAEVSLGIFSTILVFLFVLFIKKLTLKFKFVSLILFLSLIFLA